MPTLDLALTPLGVPGVDMSATVLPDQSVSIVLWIEYAQARPFIHTGFWLRMPGGVDVLYTVAFTAAGRAAFAPARVHPENDLTPRMPDVWLLLPKVPSPSIRVPS